VRRHESAGGKDDGGDLIPERVDFGDADGGLAGLGEPVAGIADIALDEVEEGVDPGAVAGVDVLGNVMSAIPVALFGVPKRLRLPGETGRRRGKGESGGLKLGG
jgi:hypothetical protein